jgi:hypothetical protein
MFILSPLKICRKGAEYSRKKDLEDFEMNLDGLICRLS